MDLNGRNIRSKNRPGRTGRGWTLIGFMLGLAVLLGGLSLFWRVEPEPLKPSAADEGRVQVYLVDNGFHTDWVFPRAAFTTQDGALADAVMEQKAGDWVYVGWGDARFFVEEGPIKARWRDGLRALLARSNPSVLRLRTGRSPLEVYGEQKRVGLNLTPTAYDRLVRHIEAGMVTEPDGAAVLAAHRSGDGTRFYAHREAFWIGHLCNHWSLQGLSAAGQTVWPLRPMTSGEVLRQARLSARRDQGLGVDLSLQAP